ncbi:MAG: hypothetical protein AAFY15_07165, partial [Cyanobacteria bacterium J06648_11]
MGPSAGTDGASLDPQAATARHRATRIVLIKVIPPRESKHNAGIQQRLMQMPGRRQPERQLGQASAAMTG